MTATARPTARPRQHIPASVGAAHKCWVDAGGGTPSYDADRYMALLKDRGVLRPRRGLVAILEVVLTDWSDEPSDPDALTESATAFARLLVDELGRDGWRIHDVALCVRPGDPIGIGRPMTPGEEAQLLLPLSDPATPAAAPPPVGETFEHVTTEGDRFLVPDGWAPAEASSRCRSCNALILWTTTPRHKRAPVNPEGTSHFATCPDASTWRKKA